MTRLDETQELEERFAQLREDLKGNYLQDFRENFLEMHIYEQSQFYQTLEKKATSACICLSVT